VTGKRRLKDEGGIALKSDKYDEGLLRCLFIILAIYVDWSRGNTGGSHVSKVEGKTIYESSQLEKNI